MKQKYKSDAFEAIHNDVSEMFQAGMTDKTTMRNFDEKCLVKPFKPIEIKRLRMQQKVSQPVFARYLNTSESTIEKWETGVKKPSGMALKLLTVIQKHGLQILT